MALTRIDRIGMTHSFITNEFPPTNAIIPPKKYLLPTEAFQINLTCASTVTTSRCNLVRQGLLNAGRRIASAIQISRQIIVKAEFKPADRANSLGGAMYASAFFIKKQGKTYTMCQALIKQLRTDVGVTFGPVDIIAEFNSNVIWYFRPGTIGNSQTDFEYVAVHELLHGMGFGSGFFEYSTVFAGAREGYLAPLMIGVKSGEATTATLLSNLEPIDIFDSFIPVLDAAGERISQFPTQSLTYLRFISAFENSGDPFRAAQQAYQSATRPLQFVSGNQNVSLYTPASFEQGSSLSHVTLAQSNQPDFLMIPQLRAGVDMDVLIGSGSLLGPGLRTVMESIGWLTSNSSTVQTVTMATDYGRKPTSSSIKVKPLWMLLLFSIFII